VTQAPEATSAFVTVDRLINAGELRAVRIGRSYRLRADDVDAYLAARYTQAG